MTYNNDGREGDKAGLGPRSSTTGPRRPKWLPWALIAAAIILLLLLLRTCTGGEDTNTVTAPATAPVTTAPTGGMAPAAPAAGPMYGQLETYLASAQPAGQRFTFDNLHFATNSAELPADAQATLSGLVAILGRFPNARVQIEGYADARGSEPQNAQLGAQRAEAVARALIGAGVAADRVTAATGSESNPIGDNATAQGQAANRRTDLVVTAK